MESSYRTIPKVTTPGLTFGADAGQQLGERGLWLGHVALDEDGDDALQLLAVFLVHHGDGLQDQLHLLQLVGTCADGSRRQHEVTTRA